MKTAARFIVYLLEKSSETKAMTAYTLTGYPACLTATIRAA
ncbi:hypothetical protein [Hydrobacter penzbergensis]|nr:hypothetical protein [Hydrobacter penzbergensis]